MSEQQGWIKLFRKFTDWEWYTDNSVKCLFIHLLLTANHTDKKWRGQTISKGELVTSVGSLATGCGLSEQQIRTALSKLEKTGEIKRRATNKNTLIIVVNYALYQGLEMSEQQTNNTPSNKQVTNKQQSNNNQITTNKNDKNVKNDKNERIIRVWNALPSPIPKIQKLTGNRKTHLNCRLNEYGEDLILDGIKNIAESDFLKGKNEQGWCATFDWFIKDSNFKKVLEGNYANRKSSKQLQGAPTYDISEIQRRGMENTEI